MKKILTLFAALLCIGCMTMKAENSCYGVYDEGTKEVTVYYDDQMEARGGTVYWSGEYQSAEIVTFDESVKDYRPKDATGMFYDFQDLKEIKNLDFLNTSEVTSMDQMFRDCESLLSLDLSSFDTKKVTNMRYMFYGCHALTELDLSSFNTEEVTTMEAMFFYCDKLISLNVSSFNTSKVTDMSTMFCYCTKLASVDVSHFNTSEVTDMSYMFSNSDITELDLRSFDISKVTNMAQMFRSSNKLKTIYCNTDWSSSTAAADNAFLYCSSLKGGMGTSYSSTSLEMARPDLPGQPGYFTADVDFEIDFRNGEYTLIAPATLPAGVVVEGTPRNDAHGYDNAVVTVPVGAGNYMITIGNCQYNGTNASVKNADDYTLGLVDANGQPITEIVAKDGCYHQNTATNISTAWLVVESPMVIKIVGPQYTPYVKFEKVESVPVPVTVYTVTFANAEGATGIVPAPMTNLAQDEFFTLPRNFTMYKEGATMTAWTNGSNFFGPGTGTYATSDMTLTAVFMPNTVSLDDRTDEVTIKWEFSQSKGVPAINVSGGTTFVVAQTKINGITIDVQLPIDATEGKFVNQASNWTQINPGVQFTIPSAKDAVITYKQYDAGAETTPSITVKSDDPTYTLVADGTSGQLYYEYIQVVLPKKAATAIDNTPSLSGEGRGEASKIIRNGQLLIEKNGKTYTVTGVQVK